MRPLALAALALPLILAACTLTPRQQCEAPYRGELRNVRAEIKSVEINLRRGFTLVPARSDFGIHYCVDNFGHARMCSADDGLAMFDKHPISRVAEQAKLNALYGERTRLGKALAVCAQQFPE